MSFSAALTVATADASRHIDALCASFAEIEMETERNQEGALLKLQRGLGTAQFEAHQDKLAVRADAATEQGISILKFLIGMRVEKVMADETPEVVWTGYGADFVVIPSFREITVVKVVDITPTIRRITYTGADMARFCAEQIHVRLLFPPKGLDKPEWPVPGKNGRPSWPPEERRPVTRLYTIRSFDQERGEIDIDFVLHGDHGIASSWAEKAQVGQLIGIMGPGGSHVEQVDWYLFAGDETAIPAIDRHLTALPRDAKGLALIEVQNESERQSVQAPEGFEVRWLHRGEVEPGRGTILLDAVKAQTVDASASVSLWLGAEAATARAVRDHWRNTLQVPRSKMHSVAYWRHELTPESEG